jgi:hypothetical protein
MELTWQPGSRRILFVGASAIALALLGGCGGGASPRSTPAPAPAPTPAPAPAPAPTPTPSSFNTTEYRQTDGPAFHNAIPAWETGANGNGVTIGIIDTGIDEDSPEFAGRIHAASADVAGTRSVNDIDGHGTQVALVAAAARNNSGIMGVAFRATIMALRADTVGSCGTVDGCTFFDSNIALGVDRAVQNGAKVINISLGGEAPNQRLINSIEAAAAADVVVIVAAGNDANDPAAVNPNQPNGFAVGIRQAGNGNVIVAGSVNANNERSDFSNRAGSERDWYLMALGEEVCCVYEEGQLLTETRNGQTFVFVVSGTSFAAPHIAGAAALVRQAFPNLTAAQTVDLLLRTARDAGAAGTDATFGRGILDIAAAFSAQGTMSLGSGQRMAQTDISLVTSSAMGDAGAGGGSLQAVMLDMYDRAYAVNLGRNLRSAGVNPRLARSLIAPLKQGRTGSDKLAMAYSIDASRRAQDLPWSGQLRLTTDDARKSEVLAAQIVAHIAPRASLAIGYAQGADGLVAQIQGSERPAFLVAGSPADDMGFAKDAGFAFAMRQGIGRWGLTVSGESGDALSLPSSGGIAFARKRRQDAYTRLGLAMDRSWSGFDVSLGASWLSEDRTILGARLHEAFGSRGADSLFLDAQAGVRLPGKWRLSAAWRQGYTRPRLSGFLASGSSLASNGWSVDVARSGVFSRGDSLALRVSQPLRVASGGVNFDLPVAYSYETLQSTRGIRRLSLAPQGREIATELAWRGQLFGGAASASLFYRKDPGHYAALPDDKGVGLTWSTEF